MKTKIKVFKNDAMAMMETCGIGYRVFCRNPSGEILDRVICDDYRTACEYYRAFQSVAKNS